MANMEEPCRWATAGDLDGRSGKDMALIDLPKCEQVTRGAALMEMLQAPIPASKDSDPSESGQLLLHLLKQRPVSGGLPPCGGGGSDAGMAPSHAWPPPAGGGACAAYDAAIMGQQAHGPLRTVPPPRPVASQPHGGWGQQHTRAAMAAESAEWQRQRLIAAAAATYGLEGGGNPHAPWGAQGGADSGAWRSNGGAAAPGACALPEEPRMERRDSDTSTSPEGGSRSEQLDAWDASSGSGETHCSESDRDFMELSRLIDESVQLGGPGGGRVLGPGVGGLPGGGSRAMRDFGKRGAPRQADAMRGHLRNDDASKWLGGMTKWDAPPASGQHQHYAAAMAHAAAASAQHALVPPSPAAACGWAGMGTRPLHNRGVVCPR